MIERPLPHVTIDEAEGKADCERCQAGVTAPVSFGGVPRADMLASFLVQHAIHTKAGKPSGLTASGKATQAALDVVMELVRVPTDESATSQEGA